MVNIDDMDQLRRGMGLRAYGQKDPVIEYQIEGFNMFDDMIKSISNDTARILLNLEVKEREVSRTCMFPFVLLGTDVVYLQAAGGGGWACKHHWELAGLNQVT